MTLMEAADLLARRYPGRKVTGYWKRENGYVLNTKPIKAMQCLTTPDQFVVTSNGEVYGTNPYREGLDPLDMIKV